MDTGIQGCFLFVSELFENALQLLSRKFHSETKEIHSEN